MTLCMAEKFTNAFMQSCDLKPDYKEFVIMKEISFFTTTNITPEYFMNIIEKSKNEKTFWIPAIIFCGVTYAAEGIKIISDGKKEFFIGKK